MKRYLVFIGDDYYPRGGFNDFAGDYDVEADAIEKAKTIEDDKYQWAHVYDTKDRKKLIDI
jgi:hypothetical protein